MGLVYRAQDPLLGRTVAIKTIRLSEFAEPGDRAELEKRLVREARSAGALGHPGVVTVHDLVQEEDLTCIVMEFVEGQTLGQMLGTGQALDNSLVLSVLRQTGAALDYAHSKGIVHRDVKPSNLIVQPGGAVKVADFGVARISTTLQLTKSGTVIGTPYYMSPEQIQGKPVDGRADQFSLAVTAYEILTGRKPFSADTLTTLMYQIVHDDPAPAENLNTTLGAQVGSVLRKALSKDPEGRYDTCAEFVDALETACSAAKGWRPFSVAELAAAPVPPPRAAAPRRWPLALAGGVLMAALAAGGYFTLRRSPLKEQPAPIKPAPVETIPAPAAQPPPVPAPADKPKAGTERARAPKPVATTPPKPAAPQEQRAETAPPVAYTGPPTGSLVWTGELEPNSQLAIDGKSSSTGSVTSELPGVPVRIQLTPSSARVVEAPGPQNRWKRLIIATGDKRVRVLIRWEVIP